MAEYRIALIHPRDSHVLIRDYSVYENLGLAHLAAYLRQDGYPVEIIDGYAENVEHDVVVDRTVQYRPDLVGFTCTYQNYGDVVEIASRVREQLPDVHFTIGGEHATYTAGDILRQSGVIDSVVRGEGEQTLLDLVKALDSSRPLASVTGIHFRSGDTVTENPPRASIGDLDCLPFAARDTLAQAHATGKSILIGMLASRGCYSRCSFCNARYFFRLGGGKAVRRRSPQNVIDEITELHENYVHDLLLRGINIKLYFYDATFIAPDRISKQWAREIATGLVERGVAVPFKAFVRADSFTEADADLIHLLKKAGLRSVFVGFESGSDDSLEAYSKGASADQNVKSVELLKRFQIFSVTNGFIMFDPYSTLDRLRASARFLLESEQASFWNMSQRLQLFPGVALIQQLAADRLLLPNRSAHQVYGYRFRDAGVGRLVEQLDFNDQPAVQRENSMVRYIRDSKETIDNLIEERGKGEDAKLHGLGERIDGQWQKIGRLNFHTFNRFVDLAEREQPQDAFLELKTRYLEELDEELDQLEDKFQSYLGYLLQGRPSDEIAAISSDSP